MPFQCPECDTAKSLHIVSKIELAPDSRSDEIALQIVECGRCHFIGIAVYEESRRGSLGAESFDHTGYYAPKDEVRALRKTMERCPKPGNHRCQCSAHRALGKRDASGRWIGLSGIHRERAFGLRL